MIGADGVVNLVVTQLATYIESRLAILDDELGALQAAADNNIPVVPTFVSPAQVPFDDISIDQWPFILVVPQGDPQMVRLDIEADGTQVFDATYQQRIFCWVRGDTFSTTAAIQRRLTQAVKECLLSKQKIGPNVRIDESSLTARYSDVVAPPELASTVAASWIGLALKAKERLTPNVKGLPAPTPPSFGTGVMAPATPAGPEGP